MRKVAIPALLFATAAFSAWLGVVLLGVLGSDGVKSMSRAMLAVFTALIGISTLLIKEVQSVEPKDALSDIGLNRVRRVQKIALRRLVWLIGLGLLGIVLASISSFDGASETGMVIRAVAFPSAVSFCAVLLALSFSYAPLLFFEIQRTRTKLNDIAMQNESRRTQLDSLVAGRKE